MSSKTGAEASDATPQKTARRPWSLATRLGVWYAASAFLLMLLGMGVLYWAMARHFNAEDDARLRARAAEILASLPPGRIDPVPYVSQFLEPGPGAVDFVLVRLTRDDGMILAETHDMLKLLPPSAVAQLEPDGDGMDIHSPAQHPFRVIAVRLPAPDLARRYVLYLAVDHQGEKLLSHYRQDLYFTMAGALLVCMGIGYWIARQGLRPIRDMAVAVRGIRATTLNQRLDEHHVPIELAELAAGFNEMLNSLEDAFGRLSRYSGDIAHELRSPVHNLRAEAELALDRARSPEEYREALGSCLEECVRLSSLIESMLFLARAENPQMQIHRERVDVDQELSAIREFYAAAAADAGLSLELQPPLGQRGPAPPVMLLDRTLFQRAMGNLIENSINYSVPGGRITISAWAGDGLLRICVKDTGRGIPAADLPHVFDRFYRVDANRSKHTGGAGLGLAIVKTIATLHGGSVRAESRCGEGTRITMTFPLSPAAPDARPAPAGPAANMVS